MVCRFLYFRRHALVCCSRVQRIILYCDKTKESNRLWEPKGSDQNRWRVCFGVNTVNKKYELLRSCKTPSVVSSDTKKVSPPETKAVPNQCNQPSLLSSLVFPGQLQYCFFRIDHLFSFFLGGPNLRSDASGEKKTTNQRSLLPSQRVKPTIAINRSNANQIKATSSN